MRLSEIDPGHRGPGLRHALAFASELKRRCWTNNEVLLHVCRDLDICWEQAKGVMQMIARRVRANQRAVPSRQRLIAAAMRDWGLDDEDIAEMFSCPISEVCWVREFIDEIRRAEPIPDEVEMQCAWMLPDDPPPDVLAHRARDIRAARPEETPPKMRRVAIRQFVWHGGQHAFLPVGS